MSDLAKLTEQIDYHARRGDAVAAVAQKAIAIATDRIEELERRIKAQNEGAIIAVTAARRVALEEAAKVAEAHDLSIISSTAVDAGARKIAAAIRNLMEEEE